MTECGHDAGRGDIPEDIAKLYLAAHLPGHSYRDFSASRRETRDRLRDWMLQKQAGQATKPDTSHGEPAERQASADLTATGESLPAELSRTESESQPLPPLAGSQEVARPSNEGTWNQERLAEGTREPAAERREKHRWFILNNIFSPESAAREARLPGGESRPVVPTLVLFSIAGGVGKTSLAATVGRALAAYGERVLLVDTTPFGLLPLYFGSRESKPGVVRTFAPPNNSPDAPVHAVTLEPGEPLPASAERDPFLEALLHDAHGSNRILVDARTASLDTVRRLLPLVPTILVPIIPDMNSVASLRAVEAVFSNEQPTTYRRVEPLYLLNQFDASLPLHVDVREILRQQLGNRLLPFVVRRSSAVSEALAEGMTVIDYAPDSSAAEEFLHLAGWLRTVSAAASGFRRARWSEK
ncbi:MAG TPA: cellulose synthase operon protein YhjQ/BcsQ [Acidobacteriaceae bacterium]|jgi:cellulose synthase operon protein YhjQ